MDSSASAPTTPYTVFVIPHTHWDREWYATFQQYRIRLVHVIDALLALLERDPAYAHFNLDAQTIVLQDYLEIRPEQREALRKHVSARRLGVGPWYVLPDEFLVSGEALVRNLMLGHRLAEEFGHVQKVGYIPDTFGHISQLPQILRGFNIGSAVHFRGLDEGDLKSEIWWQSPDGSRVLLRHLPTDMGYLNAAALPADAATGAGDLLAIAVHEKRRAAGTVLLALNGVDHLPAHETLPALVAAANELAAGGYQFWHGSLDEYFDALTADLAGRELQTVHGELRQASRTPDRAGRLLPDILSARIYLKQANERIQALLERWAEPWSALAWLHGADYPQAFLWKAWEWLLQNHPHDSIGGCSIDAVHAQMETRFAWAEEIAAAVTAERFELLARQLDLSDLAADEAALVVFNGLPWPVEGGMTVDIDLWNIFLEHGAMARWQPLAPESDLTPESGAVKILRRRSRQQWSDDRPSLPDPRFRGLRLRPLGSAEPLPVQIESMTTQSVLRPLVSGPPTQRAVTRVRASFAAAIPAYGYQVYAVQPAPVPNRPLIAARPANVLENETLRVEIAANGTFSVADKRGGEVFHGLGYFEDGGDCGDGYNYSPPAEDRVENTLGLPARISRLSAGPVRQVYEISYDWLLPESLDDARRSRRAARVSCALSVRLSLLQGVPRLDLEVTFDNRARDHRLRLLFPSDIITEASAAGAQFDVVRHPIQVEPVPPAAWLEDAVATFPQHEWVDVSDGRRGLCLINQGLPEYEVLNTERREIAITLLRAVGYLGAGTEMQAASVGAGPNIATPEAQIQRRLAYSLAVLPHTGAWDQAEVWRQALAHNNPPRPYTTGMFKQRPAGGSWAASQSFLSVEGRNAVLSAVKRAEDAADLIVRLYNPSTMATRATLQLPFVPARVRLAGLDEHVLPAADSPSAALEADGRLGVDLPAGKIVTLRLSRG
ncbi:MAG: glycoside hydrolase family 38 C-terminal domain-containing protein [Anaerolineales bacterium]